ncbi:RidA family protein [Candidatus Enterococcus lemimoniae]|uniref:Uncharacterized protein n=1 Tax=Candidatus Enterococcus lemimoniae TaxID=1834167 RepID=A0ABZ2T1W5_9ENTE|nr:RidA family protein [Enterococcus sp. 12C11_DIV0727]OTO69440.1 hypothetical protein A5866_001640 [Enterococcus sp. 12C11_DIV0727]
MKKKFKSIEIFPYPYAPFNLSQGISLDNLLFISGQTSINKFGNLLHSGDFTAQAEQAFTNLRTVLKAGNSSLDHVLKSDNILNRSDELPNNCRLAGKIFFITISS